jgi:SAM-dependent methyltransferase
MPATCAGEEYVRLVGHTPERHTFQQVALALAAPHSNIFDFGSGPGLDAEVYARHGHAVDAYDQDPAMREYFARHCAEMIREGRVTQRTGTYEEFLRADDGGWADLITSNYAPLSLVTDLPPLFARLHRLSRGRARMLACVLNPLYHRDLRRVWWWRNLRDLLWRGEHYVQLEHARIYRRSAGRIAELAAPFFRLVDTRRLTFNEFILIVLERVE